MDQAQKSRKAIEALNQTVEFNGNGLDKATLDTTLDRLIETMESVNRELDGLLAKVRGE
jgi:hypothetical protein